MLKRGLIASSLLAIFLSFAAYAFADGPSRDAGFYASGRWRIENPVWNTWVTFNEDGGYQVYEYVWANIELDNLYSEFAMSADDPRITVRTLETGRYEVTATGLRLAAGFIAERAPDGRRPLTGDYTLSTLEYSFARYYLDGYHDCLCASVDFMPEAGTVFPYDGRDLRSMKGAKARARRRVELAMDPVPRARTGMETEFGNVERFEEGWTVDVLASFRLDANAGSATWYYVRKELYPQEEFWGWAPADSLELVD